MILFAGQHGVEVVSCTELRDIIYILKLIISILTLGNYQSEIFLAKGAAEVFEPMIGPVHKRAVSADYVR